MPGIPPWHLWGSSKTVPIQSDVVRFSTTQQIAQVNYARPESWRFFFKVAVLQVNGSAVGSTMTVDFNMTFGVGRATTSLKPFARFVFTAAELAALTIKQITTVEMQGESAARVSPNIIEVIPAQTIQLEAVASFDSLALITGGNIECAGFFTPNAHVRPEWFLRAGELSTQFPGDEHRGK